ncbi:MAG: transcriptional regulator, partial [Polyangiaceae bacterium]
MSRFEAARERATEDAKAPTTREADGRERTIRVAIGDSQAPIGVFLKILDDHDLLGDDGRLKPHVALTSMGDHFDWGSAAEHVRASIEGLEILSWLAAHPRDQVTIIAGNHDLARVGELARFDDATFARAQAEAVPAYTSKDPELEKRFLAHFPDLPSSEIAARDFSAFTVAQRELVVMLLRDRRLRIAHAAGRNFMLSHAGVTIDDLDA